MAAKAVAIPGSSGVLVCETAEGYTFVPTAVYGWNVEETSGSAVVQLALYDGTDNSGALLADIEVDKSEEKTITLAEPVEVDSGSVYLDIVSGACSGEIYLG